MKGSIDNDKSTKSCRGVESSMINIVRLNRIMPGLPVILLMYCVIDKLLVSLPEYRR